MALISEEQRRQEIGARKAMEAEAQRLAREEEQKPLVLTETMRRLQNRLRYRIIDVKLHDDEGEFTMQVRPLTLAEEKEIQRIIQGAKDNPNSPLDDEFCRLLADLCWDKHLDFNYWKNGTGIRYDKDIPVKLVIAAKNLAYEDEKSIRFFQRAKKGKASSSS